jgi:transcriptional regulator with XRE-family HTH domain
MPRYSPARLKAARQAAGLSQADLAALVGKSVRAIQKYDQGEVIPTVAVLGAIARAVDVPIGELFDADDATDPVAAFTAEIKTLVDRMPPFTAEQRSRLRALLRGVA